MPQETMRMAEQEWMSFQRSLFQGEGATVAWHLHSQFPRGEEAEARTGVGAGADGASAGWVLLWELGVIWGMSQRCVTVCVREREVGK